MSVLLINLCTVGAKNRVYIELPDTVYHQICNLYGTIDPVFKTLYTIFLKDAKVQRYNGPIDQWKPSKTALAKIQQKHKKYLHFSKTVSSIQRVSMNGVQFWASSYQKVTYCVVCVVLLLVCLFVCLSNPLLFI